MDELLTVREIAEELKVAPSTVQRWYREELIPAVKIGRALRIKRSDLEQWYNSYRTQIDNS